ncbi:protein phosphatase 1 regulatory subunit 37-like, partial [Empidonax traillii]|uniref:protein phosphatase 1 regulatory subunit 37-like n=1 Tax=Empidonax traillii TaxID=164674 RepID=UPI000FFDBB20
PHTQSLETLNLGHNPIGNEGVRNLKNGLIGNRSVLRLGLASTKLTCEGAVAVAEFIAKSPPSIRVGILPPSHGKGNCEAPGLSVPKHSRGSSSPSPQVKSFIETQKALLAEIQNGCKRNFILAKEQEEKEQQLQPSASMPEITVTGPENRDGDKEEDKEEDEEDNSDTDEEGAEPEGSGPPRPPERPQDRPCPPPAPREAPAASTAASTVASTAASPGLQRRISVSSPGRGHKVFVVTRVEPLPDGGDAGSRIRIHPGRTGPFLRATNPRRSRSRIRIHPGRTGPFLRAAGPTRIRIHPGRTGLFLGPAVPESRRLDSEPDPSWENRAVPGAVPEGHQPDPDPDPSRENGAIPEGHQPAPEPDPDPDPSRENGAVVPEGPRCGTPSRDPPLPNGLKADFAFARALPEAPSEGGGKGGSCGAQHELSCSKKEQELEELLLEELLLEASRDPGQEPL